MKLINHILPISLAVLTPSLLAEEWKVDTQEAWDANKAAVENITIKDAIATPTAETALFKSILKSFPEKRSAQSITLSQAPTWLNWEPIDQLGPRNLQDAPVAIRVGEGDYWLFGRYGGVKKGKAKGKDTTSQNGGKVGAEVKLEGFDIPLTSTSIPNVFNAQGGKQKSLGGYHAWQSKDMKNWVHHGPVSTEKGKWLTTAERVGDKTYFYYDFPNDQDPHLIIDSDLTDGKVGKEMGMSFEDPSDGSDCTVFRDRDGKFHLISENWSVLNASKRSWDSPLANHAISEDGIKDWKIVDPAVDYRTTPTGEYAYFYHPHWTRENPERFPGEVAPKDSKGQNGVIPGKKFSKSKYEIHTPEQEAYGDWASIAIGGQYYLFGDYDPAGAHGKEHMKTVWFTSDDINKPFKKCGTIGKGHPDPDVIFAEGQFYIISQTNDFVSSGPWVDGVEVRVGVDTDNDKKIDQWTEWTTVKETYSGVEGFAKHVDRAPAQMDLTSLPDGYGFQYEIRITDKTKNDVTPVLDKVVLNFAE